MPQVSKFDEYSEHAVREVLLRLVGKRHVGELVPFELLVALILSENRRFTVSLALKRTG